jgi:hypothetical protein
MFCVIWVEGGVEQLFADLLRKRVKFKSTEGKVNVDEEIQF